MGTLNINIETKSVRSDYRAVTETEKARYDLRYTVENGKLRRVSASVRAKNSDGGAEDIGSLSYEGGQVYVERMAYDAEEMQAIVTDFGTVVAAIGTDAGKG